MKYNPAIHHRRSIRLKEYDYSQSGIYFVTICVQDKQCLFGKIFNGEMALNDAGKIVMQCWLEISHHFPDTFLHEYVIMPNHMHGIIELTVGAKNFSPENNTDNSPENNTDKTIVPETAWAKNFSPLRPIPRPCGTSRTIGSIIRGFKIGVTKQIGYSIWQRNYHEHIIRNEKSYQYITNYIINNPVNWEKDRFYYQEEK